MSTRVIGLRQAMQDQRMIHLAPVYCASPTWDASENAARELAALGYTNVQDYAEGKQDWIDAGLPTKSEHKH